MAAPTIEQALQLSDELADDDLENLLSALDARGFRGDHRAGRTFQRFNAESLIPPLTKRQAGLLTTVQELLALETEQQPESSKRQKVEESAEDVLRKWREEDRVPWEDKAAETVPSLLSKEPKFMARDQLQHNLRGQSPDFLDTVEGPTLANGRCYRKRMPVDLVHQAFRDAGAVMEQSFDDITVEDWERYEAIVEKIVFYPYDEAELVQWIKPSLQKFVTAADIDRQIQIVGDSDGILDGPNGSFLCFLEFKTLLLEVELQLARYQQAQVAGCVLSG